jgi:hypothetical protein
MPKVEFRTACEEETDIETVTPESAMFRPYAKIVLPSRGVKV